MARERVRKRQVVARVARDWNLEDATPMLRAYQRELATAIVGSASNLSLPLPGLFHCGHDLLGQAFDDDLLLRFQGLARLR